MKMYFDGTNVIKAFTGTNAESRANEYTDELNKLLPKSSNLSSYREICFVFNVESEHLE